MVATDLLLPKPISHHSELDWDFSEPDWTIDTGIYVSPPSSIRWSRAASLAEKQICRHPSTLHLPEGKLITWVRANHSYVARCNMCFRNTSPVGSALALNCYHVLNTIPADYWRLGELVDGTTNRSWQTDKSVQPINTWLRYRLTWWLSDWGMTVTLERWQDEAWVAEGQPITVIDPLYGDESIQRIGILPSTYSSTRYVWFDDTEIWAIS